jgi:tungstate transport system permease protein
MAAFALEPWSIVWLSLRVTCTALLLSALAGVPLGTWLGLARFRGKGLVTACVYTGMGLPPVVVGLAVYLLLSRSGPLAVLGGNSASPWPSRVGC